MQIKLPPIIGHNQVNPVEAITIGIITWPFFGHLYPTLSLGADLLAQGFRVIWLCEIDSFKYMLPENGEFIQLESPVLKERAETVSPYGLESLKELYEDTLLPRNEFLYQQLLALHQQHHFNFIITDQQAFAGALFAYQQGIAWATSVTAPAAIEASADFPEVHLFEKREVLKFQQRMGCDVAEPLVWAASLMIVYTTTDFLQNNNFPDNYYFVGPSTQKRREWDIDISDIQAPTNRPMVLITIGSVIRRESAFIDKIVEAFAPLDITFVLVAEPEMRASWPENFLVYPYVPQLEVLKKADAVVCHAGHNTVCEALNEGLPLITIPVAYDQSYVATKVKNCGAGIRLKYRRLRSADLREALINLLENPAYRQAARDIQASFQRAGGSARAAQIVKSLLQQYCLQKERVE